MKNIPIVLAAVLLFAPAAMAQGEVSSAEILGIDTTLPHSPYAAGYVMDDSVGEAVITVVALDAEGNPVAGAPVEWRVANNGSGAAYVVGSSREQPQGLAVVGRGEERPIDGGVTGADGRAHLVVDSFRSGDATVSVTVGGVEAETYSGGGMRVVWF